MSLQSTGMAIFSKIFLAIALIAATIISPPALSFIPIVLLVWYLFFWRWPFSAIWDLLTKYFMFFAIALLFSTYFNPIYSLLIALPVLLVILDGLETTAGSPAFRNTGRTRSPSVIYINLLLIAVLSLGASLFFGNTTLLLASAIVILFYGILGILVIRRFPVKAVEETRVQKRMLAGNEDSIDIKLTPGNRWGGLLLVESPYQWLKASPNIVPLNQPSLTVKVTLSPLLSGPSIIKLNGRATDRWGIMQTRFELEPLRLYVTPRARYAAWLAKRYLEGTRPGNLPLITNTEAITATYGLRRGIEYYGSQLYQPGDSLKNIDWKHSLKYNELITKEYTEFHGQPAVILINLGASDAEEADKLAYNIIATALSLAQENIPAALAVYDLENVKLTTPVLQPQNLVSQSTKVAQEIVTFANPKKYLSPPDISRLRSNIRRIRFAESEASRVLAKILQLEYDNLSNNTRLHPATKALNEVFNKVDKQSNIVIISNRNHDAEALSFNTYTFTRNGNTVIAI
jgi:hypothetical protein